MKLLQLILIFLPLVSFTQVIPKNILIARDSFGVPHIFAPTDPEVAYGLAWAHAEDDFTTLQLVVLSGKARLGTALGKNGAKADYVVQLLRCRQLVEDQWHLLSPDFIALIKGYVQGLNDYAIKHPKQVKYKAAFPFSEQEYLTATVFSLSIFCGVDKTLTNMLGGRLATLPGFTSEGSNAFAIHSSKSGTGEAYLAINAHQPIEGPTAFYEAHLNSEQGWNMLGGLFPGGCLIFHGTNEHLGWAHTVNNPDKIDVYQLKVNPKNNNEYKFDGAWLKLEKRKARFKIKHVPFTVSKWVYWSKYGATIKTKQGVFAMRLPANMDCKALEEWYRMNKAKNFTEFYEALRMVSLPMFNIVYADRYDTIFYISNAKLPQRNPHRSFQWNTTLRGDTSATLWTNFKPITSLPQYINPAAGYLYNTNHSPFFATAPSSNLAPATFDPNDGFELYHNNRSKRAEALLAAKSEINYTYFKQIKFDRTYPKKLMFTYGIKNMLHLDTLLHPSLKDIIITLQQWDYQASQNSKGAAIFLLVYELLSKKMKGQSPREITSLEAVETLQHVYDYLIKYFGTINVTLGEIQKLVRGDKVLPAAGLPDVLAASYTSAYENGQRRITTGDAYICFVRYQKNGLPVIESVNTFGSSQHPGSPHFDDQMSMFQQQQLKTMSLDKKDVLLKAVHIYSPL